MQRDILGYKQAPALAVELCGDVEEARVGVPYVWGAFGRSGVEGAIADAVGGGDEVCGLDAIEVMPVDFVAEFAGEAEEGCTTSW